MKDQKNVASQFEARQRGRSIIFIRPAKITITLLLISETYVNS